MKLKKLKNIIALVIVCLMLFALASCNKVKRPEGAKNNSTDNSNRLQQLLVKDTFVPDDDDDDEQEPPADDDDDDEQEPPADDDDDDEQEPPADDDDDEQEPPVDDEPELSDTPFNAPGDVITKINEILGQLSQESVDATSATGVKDALMTSRTVTVYAPYEIFKGQDDAIASIASNLNMNIDFQVIQGDYTGKIRQMVLAGKKADLMYVDQEAWGITHHFTQEITKYVNFSIADKLDTFSSALSSKFAYGNPADQRYYVASGISTPYMLMFNKNNVIVPEKTISGDIYTDFSKLEEDEKAPDIEYKDVVVKDPITMYTEGTWGVSAFTEILKANTVSGKVGMLSFMNDDRNFDIWFGMEDNAGFAVDNIMRSTNVDASMYANEALDNVGAHMDALQALYWTTTGEDESNYVANFIDAGHGTGTIDTAELNATYDKMLGTYKGADLVSSTSFVAVDFDEYTDVVAYAKAQGVEVDFVPMPYGFIAEQAIRSTDPDEAGLYADENGNEVAKYAASKIGGFSVIKTCENPAVALRVAEEITKAWKTNYEATIVSTMTEAQQARYAEMKKNPGISFFRSIYANTASSYHTTNATEILNRLDDGTRNTYQGFQVYSATPEVLTQPMYAKNTTVGPYEANTFQTWSEFFYGKKSDIDGSVLSSSILPSLTTAFLPATMLFND